MPQYFDPAPSAPSAPQEIAVALRAGPTLHLTTDRGVFSSSRVDPGTKVLLDVAPPPPATGTLVDVGCGYGPLAVALGVLSPGAEVWAVDVNERARALCRANAKANGVKGLQVVGPADVPHALRVDLLWSNPPIRIGKAALWELLTGWLDRLTPTGAAYLVVQKHLGADSLAARIDEAGWPTTRARSKQGYRILEVRPRREAA